MTPIAPGVPIVGVLLAGAPHLVAPASTGSPTGVTPPPPHLLTLVGGFPAAGVSAGMPPLAGPDMRGAPAPA